MVETEPEVAAAKVGNRFEVVAVSLASVTPPAGVDHEGALAPFDVKT